MTVARKMAAAYKYKKERLSSWTNINSKRRNASTRAFKMRHVEFTRPAKNANPFCRRLRAFRELFHNRGCLPELAQFFFSQLHSFQIFSVNRCVSSSSWRGRKSASSRGRLAPVWKTLFIHQNVKWENMLAPFCGSAWVCPSSWTFS